MTSPYNAGDYKRTLKLFSAADIAEFRQEQQKRLNLKYTSNRPLRCLHSQCRKHVSSFSIYEHFIHEHPEIPIVSIMFGEKHAVTIKLELFNYGLTNCASIFTPNLSDSVLNIRKRNLFLLMAAKVSFDEVDEKINPSKSETSDLTEDDKFLIWICSNSSIPQQFNYTLEAFSHNEQNIISFCGPVYQLEYQALQVCKDGYGLIINQHHFAKLTADSTLPINVTICIDYCKE